MNMHVDMEIRITVLVLCMSTSMASMPTGMQIGMR